MPTAIYPGTSTRIRIKSTLTRRWGWSTRYAPKTPEIAPDAPRHGVRAASPELFNRQKQGR
jgi:hypothetical protein